MRNLNLLVNWKENIKTFAWRNALQNTSPYSEINRIYETLTSFIPENQLIVKDIYRDHNSITQILTNYDIVSIYQLLDYVLIIEYFQNHPNKECVRLKNKEGQINFNEFDDRLFELYFNKLLNDNSLKTRIDKSYTLKTGIKKPLDSFLDYNNKEYLVECKKVNFDRMRLIERLLSKVLNSINRFKKDLHISEVFKGFVGIKKQSFSSADIHKIFNSFDSQTKKYFSDYRNNKDKNLNLEHVLENEVFKLYLTPAYYDKKIEKKNLDSTFKHYISFNSNSFDYANNRFKLDIAILVNFNDLENQLVAKIKKKIKQHKESSINDKLIIFGFDATIRNNRLDGHIPDLDKVLKRINFDFIDNKQLSIVFLIKTFSSQKPTVKLSLAYDDNFDLKLRETLLKLQYNWW